MTKPCLQSKPCHQSRSSHKSDRFYVATYLVPLNPWFVWYMMDSCVPKSIWVSCQGDLYPPPCNKLLKHIACLILPPTGPSGILSSSNMHSRLGSNNKHLYLCLVQKSCQILPVNKARNKRPQRLFELGWGRLPPFLKCQKESRFLVVIASLTQLINKFTSTAFNLSIIN